MTLSENLLYYWLSLSAVSVRRLNAILEVYSPFQVWDELGQNEALSRALGERNEAALLRFKSEEYLLRAVENLDKSGIGFVARSDNRFPERLRQREVCPPLILYYKGDLSLLDTDGIAIVGTRACSRYGKEMAEKFARELSASQVTVISGLATGIDMYAHQAALESGGKTIAVLGSGLNHITPVSNTSLGLRVAEHGLLISEYAPNLDATRYTFPERNRIVSALSLGVLVIEAPLRSGALITANFAAEQGREVFCVPANLNSVKSQGSNELLRGGAHFVTGAEDICALVSHTYHQVGQKKSAVQLDIFQQKIYNLLQNGDENFDNLILKLQISPSELLSALSALEIYGLVVKKQANVYAAERG